MERPGRQSVGVTGSVPAIVPKVLGAPGQPLDPGARRFMESRFGQDFSQVRIHADARAAESAREMNAAAYTVGRSIVFAPRRYAPGSPEGRRLLAHELTHVVQQEGSTPQSAGRLRVDAADSMYEREAADVASRVTAAPAPAFGAVAAPLSAMRHPTISRMGVQALQRSIDYEVCLAPSETVGDYDSSKFGRYAETLVMAEYCAKKGCSGDVFLDLEGLSPRAYNSFLVRKNAQTLSDETVRLVPDSLKRPDILVHKPAEKEFYEMKPDSSTGRSAGTKKVETIQSYMTAFGLPYVGGTTYNPTEPIPLGTIPSGGIDFEGYLKVWLGAPGLLLYKVCTKFSLEVDWETIKDVIGAIVLGVLAFFATLLGLRGGGVLQPAPNGIIPVDPGISSNDPAGPSDSAGAESVPVA